MKKCFATFGNGVERISWKAISSFDKSSSSPSFHRKTFGRQTFGRHKHHLKILGDQLAVDQMNDRGIAVSIKHCVAQMSAGQKSVSQMSASPMSAGQMPTNQKSAGQKFVGQMSAG